MTQTKDSETIDPSELMKDQDVFCQVTEQTYLGKISDSWHDLQSAREYFDYCDNKFPNDKRDSARFASGYSLEELEDIDNLSRIIETTIALKDLERDKFDALARDVYQTIGEWMAHEKRKQGELTTLQESQVSKTKSIQQEITQTRESIGYKQKEIEKLGSAILIEGAFLFAALILGSGAGIWGAVIAVIVVLVWRSGAT